jgi:hypothetical protein
MAMTAKALRGTRAALIGSWLPLVLGVAETATGQEAPGRPQRPPRIAPPPHSTGQAPEEPTLLSVEFPGGTIKDYIEVLAKAAPDLNVVIRPETAEIPMPPVSLKGVAHGTALQLIPALAESGGEIKVQPVLGPSGSGSEVYVIGTQPPQAPGTPVMNVTYGGTPGMPGRAMRTVGPTGLGGALPAVPGVRPPKSVRVFSLRSLTSGSDALKPETVLTAIDTALGLQRADDEGEPASIKLHAESGLLVVHGAPEQIDVVEQVLTTMERDIRSQATAQQQALQNENMNLKHNVERLEKKVAELEATLKNNTELDLKKLGTEKK